MVTCDGRVSRAGVRLGMVMVITLAAGCSSPWNSRAASAPAPAPRTVSYWARNADRVDLAQWTLAGQQVTGFVDSRWVNPADPFDLQSGSVNFAGTLRGTHLTAIAADGSGAWVGTIDNSRLSLLWTSGHARLKTTFVLANTADFDAAVQVLGDQVAAASARVANTNAAVVAAAKSRVVQAQQQLKTAARLAAVARADAGRRSAAKAAARRHAHA